MRSFFLKGLFENMTSEALKSTPTVGYKKKNVCINFSYQNLQNIRQTHIKKITGLEFHSSSQSQSLYSSTKNRIKDKK